MNNTKLHLYVFSGIDGSLKQELPFNKISWSDSINEQGSMTCEIPNGNKEFLDSSGALNFLSPWENILAVKYAGHERMLHAGYITGFNYDTTTKVFNVTCGGVTSILEKRLVIPYRLHDRNKYWVGRIRQDNEDYWRFYIKSTIGGIAYRLVEETKKWGDIPLQVIVNSLVGDHERNYSTWDMATVWQRIQDLGNLQEGIEFYCSNSYRESEAKLYNYFYTSDDGQEFKPPNVNYWKWNACAPQSPISMDKIDDDGSDVCSSVFALGARDNDYIMYDWQDFTGERPNRPLLQVADTSHSSVSNLYTLDDHVISDIRLNSGDQMSYQLSVPISERVFVGDWADVYTDEYQLQELKITDVKGSSDSDFLTLGARGRVD